MLSCYKLKTPFAFAKGVLFVIPKGFEPLTHRLEICCSIQLSYGTISTIVTHNITKLDVLKKPHLHETNGVCVGVAGFEPTTFCSQSRRDTGLRYTPKFFICS